jgi:hypothetical protein
MYARTIGKVPNIMECTLIVVCIVINTDIVTAGTFEP